MKRNLWKKLLSLALATLMLAGCCATSLAEADDTATTVLDLFVEPDADAKPMARMWFPDAGAGADDDDSIEKQILELADKGFGGVEVCMLADGTDYNNEEGREYGWGTENWIKLLKKVLKAAAKVDGGFQVDMTITAHWPPTLNTIDPNDEAASKELSYSVTKITPEALENGTIELNLPAQRTDGDEPNFFGQTAYDHFLFTDTFVSATVAQITDIVVTPGENGAADTVTYEYDFSTLQSLTDGVEVIPDAGYAAGVPDQATAEANGWDYDEICEFFGPESEGPWTSENGKLDANGNRKRMADWQNMYSASMDGVTVEASEGNALAIGDWVIVSTFYRGTGQSIPGGRIMANGVFVTNYFNESGTAAVTSYWEQMFEQDPELKELMQANPGYIFEDSIEATYTTAFWSDTLLDDVDDNYVYKDILSLVAASKFVSSGTVGEGETVFFSFSNDDGMMSRIYQDYNDKLAELYLKYRVTTVTDWAEETVGWGFRSQTYHLPGLEIGRAAMAVDVAECDNMSKGDGVRYQAGTVNITDRDNLTMEAITGPSIGYVTMDDVLTELGQNYSDGVTRAILHGTPYTKTFNGYNSEWPGWLPFGPGNFGSAYTYRQAYWEDFSTETGFMSRVQAVLQNGEAQIDLAVFIDTESTFDFEVGNRFQALLDSGFSYNLVSESVLQSDNAVMTDGVLAADGPAYKALIVDSAQVISLEGMNRIKEYADAGLPVIFHNCDITRVYGSDVAADAEVAAIYEEISAMDNVRVVSDEAGIQAALAELNVTSHAKYDASQLETTMYTDTADNTNYYYMFNNAYPENSGMMSNDQGENYKGEDKVLRNVTVTLEGIGVPYALDPYTGEIKKVADYTANDDGTVTFTFDSLYGGNAIIYAVTENTEAFDAVSSGETVHVTEAEAIDLADESWSLVIHSYGPDDESNDPAVSKITDVDFGAQKLGKWCDIEATQEQLDEIGVTDMKYVSGTGEYSLTLTMPENWDEYDGAFIAFTYGKDQIGAVTVNGTKLAANNACDRVDLGDLLKAGENEIVVKLSTSLYGRMYVEHMGYQEAGTDFGMGKGFMAAPEPDTYYNGLLDVQIVPYTIAE